MKSVQKQTAQVSIPELFSE
jgi:MFS transporter, SP family, arabinose:H+ symporter